MSEKILNDDTIINDLYYQKLLELKISNQEEQIHELNGLIDLYKELIKIKDEQIENLAKDIAENLVDLLADSFLNCKYYSRPLMMYGVNTFGVCNNPEHNCNDGTIVQCDGFLCMDKVIE